MKTILREILLYCINLSILLLFFIKQDAIAAKSFQGTTRILKVGSIEDGFKEADGILEGEVKIGGQEHFYMETQGCIVVPKDSTEEMEVYASTQGHSEVQVRSDGFGRIGA